MQATIMLFCGIKSCIAYYYDEIEDSDTIKVKRVNLHICIRLELGIGRLYESYFVLLDKVLGVHSLIFFHLF